jgi:hypothetical protein
MLLSDSGWKILRVWGDEVVRDPEEAARYVLRRLTARLAAEFLPHNHSSNGSTHQAQCR